MSFRGRVSARNLADYAFFRQIMLTFKTISYSRKDKHYFDRDPLEFSHTPKCEILEKFVNIILRGNW